VSPRRATRLRAASRGAGDSRRPRPPGGRTQVAGGERHRHRHEGRRRSGAGCRARPCLDVNGASTTDGASVQQWACLAGATNQQFTLRTVSYAGNEAHDYQLVARHSGKCVDVSGVSTAARAAVHQWTCNPAGQGSPLNQTGRLWGR